jgi:hypothetical protein
MAGKDGVFANGCGGVSDTIVIPVDAKVIA